MYEIILTFEGSQRHVKVKRSLIPSWSWLHCVDDLFNLCYLLNVPHGGFRPCNGIHAVITTANVFDVCLVPTSHHNPCDRLYHCEKRCSVRKQTMIYVFCNEGVFLTDRFAAEINGMFVGFYNAKILPHCNGCSYMGSGLDNAVIEAKVFKKRTLISILIESHYYRSKQSMLTIVKVTDTLSWEVFFPPFTFNSMKVWYRCRCFWARRMPKSHVPHSCRYFNSYNLCLSRKIPPWLSAKWSLRRLDSTWTSRTSTSLPRIGKDGGGFYMSPACK